MQCLVHGRRIEPSKGKFTVKVQFIRIFFLVENLEATVSATKKPYRKRRKRTIL